MIPDRHLGFADLAVGYKTPILNGRTLDFRVNVNNLANDRSLIGLASVSGGTTPLYATGANPRAKTNRLPIYITKRTKKAA